VHVHDPARGAGRYKGIAVLRNDASQGELQDLQAAGVIGVAFNVAMYGVDFYRDIEPLLERMRDFVGDAMPAVWIRRRIGGTHLTRMNRAGPRLKRAECSTRGTVSRSAVH
jgi:hypothetical protein